MTTHDPDIWSALQRHTAARIALGRAGGSLPTAELLRFAAAHADARDAVHAELDIDQLRTDLAPLGLPTMVLQTQAHDRTTYLQRPDLGRKLDEESVRALNGLGVPPSGGGGGVEKSVDLAFILASGLSAPALQQNAAPLLTALLPKLQPLTFAPLIILRHARVAIQDQIGQLLHAKLAVILLGERPGLTAPASLGAYLVFNPNPQNSDANRNCISNIHPAGLPPAAAANTLHHLITESLQHQISGIALKDDRPRELI